MPLYLVRWPSFVCTLVRARDLAEAEQIVADFGAADCASIMPYRGPVCVSFALPLVPKTPVRDGMAVEGPRPLSAADVEIGDIEEVMTGCPLEAQVGNSSEGLAMQDEMMRLAFPALYRALLLDRIDDVGTEMGDEVDWPPDDDAVLEALREEALRTVRASWQRLASRRSLQRGAQNQVRQPARVRRRAAREWWERAPDN